MTLGVRGINPVWTEVDLQGNLFDDNFYMYVLENVLPYVPATVYHDPDLSIAWTNPIQFYANGTLPTDIFFESDKVYRLEFRQNNGLLPPSQSDPLIYEINDYVPGTGGSSPIDTIASQSSNEITNPQFALVNFLSSFSLSGSNPDPIQIAPGWFLTLTGSGSVTATQVALNSTNRNPSNAPYALRLTLNAWSTATLSQRFNQNGMLWASTLTDTYVSNAITARLTGANQTIRATMTDSLGTPLGTILNDVLVTQNWTEFKDHLLMPETSNTNVPPAAYIQYNIILPGSIDIYLTSVQLSVSDLPINPAFEQDTIERQIDHTFHHYSPQLKAKPIPSLLTGWDFPLNPFQFDDSGSISTTPSYVADQTIAATSKSTMNWGRITYSGSPSFTSSTNAQAFYIQQYLSGYRAMQMTLSKLAAYLNVYQLTHTGTVARVYLYYNATGGTIPSLATGLGTVSDSGVFTLTASGWVSIPLVSGFSNQYTLTGTTNFNEVMMPGFNGFQYFGSATTANFAIVVTFACPASGTSVVVNSVGLMKGDIATTPAPQSLDTVLRECQVFYERSRNVRLSQASLTDSQEFPSPVYVSLPSAASPASLFQYAGAFTLNYKNVKRAAPIFTPISTFGGVSGSVTHRLYYTGVANAIAVKEADITLSPTWSQVIGLNYANFFPTVTSTIDTVTGGTNNAAFFNGYISLQYILDARFGVV